MVKSKIHTSMKGGEGFIRLAKMLKKYPSAYVTVGVHEGAGSYENGISVMEVALFQEFGTHTIPERSFIRSSIDDNASKINAWREEAIGNIIEKGWSLEKALEMIGLRLQLLVQNKIKSNVPPPYGAGHGNSPEVIAAAQARKAAKGQAPVTLIATGLLLRSVGYKVHLK